MGSVTRSYRIRAYPNGAQRRLRDRWFGAYRWLWNTALEIRTEAYRECGLSLDGNDISRWLTQWKRTPGHEWLKLVPATCLTQCLRDQDRAFSNFFAGRSRHPRFKYKSASWSLRFQNAGRGWSKGILSLPKLGVLKLAESIPQVTRPDLVSVATEPLSLSCQCPAVGVDLGITYLAALSTGEKIENPKRYQARLRYLRQQQRLILIEDLNVAGMARGRSARAIHDASFGDIRRQLTYKSDWRHKILIEVDRWYPSSKTCSVCRHRLDELRLAVREWKCPKCGTLHDRDVNAAGNLLLEGFRQLAGRDDRDLCVDAVDACP